MTRIINFADRKASRNQDLYVEMLNDPARIARVKAKREAELEKARQEAEAKEIEKYRRQRMDEFVIKVAMALCFCVTIISVLAALRVI